jgi:hypothetical protein
MVKSFSAETFQKNVRKPEDYKKPGSIGGYSLHQNDPYTDLFAKKHTRLKHDDRAGNGGELFNAENIKRARAAKNNRRLNGHGTRGETKVYEQISLCSLLALSALDRISLDRLERQAEIEHLRVW